MTVQTLSKTNVAKTSAPILLNQTPESQILAVIKATETKRGFFGITNYRNSKGFISNIVGTVYGADAYPKLLKRSIEQVTSNELELPSELHGMTISGSVWDAAIAEQVASWHKSLDGGHDRKDTKTKVVDDAGNEKHGFYKRGETAYLFNVKVVSRNVTPEQKAHNDTLPAKSVPKSPKAAAKAYLRSNTEVSSYQGQFKLDPENFGRLAFSGTTIEVTDLPSTIGTLIAADDNEDKTTTQLPVCPHCGERH
jgi:hypothetical protein